MKFWKKYKSSKKKNIKDFWDSKFISLYWNKEVPWYRSVRIQHEAISNQ